MIKKIIKKSLFFAFILYNNSYTHKYALTPDTFIDNYIPTSDKINLYTFIIRPHNKIINKTLFFIHGACQHSHQFMDLFNFLVKNNITVISYDSRGHGRSGGKRGHVPNLRQMIDDLETVYTFHYKNNKITEPIYLLAHSFACTECIYSLLHLPTNIPIKSIILTSPVFGINQSVLPPTTLHMLRIAQSWVPDLTLPNPLRNYAQQLLTHDAHQAHLIDTDPFILRSGHIKSLLLFCDAIEKTHNNLDMLTIPIHMLIAGNDLLTDIEKSRTFYTAIPKKARGSITVFNNMYHELFHELERKAVYYKVRDIINN